MRHSFTPEIDQMLEEKVMSGHTLSEIQVELNQSFNYSVPRSTLYKHLLTLGLSLRRKKRLSKPLTEGETSVQIDLLQKGIDQLQKKLNWLEKKTIHD